MSPSPGLFLLTNRKAASRPLLEICEAALTAGFAAVMLREKDLAGRDLLHLAEPLHRRCREMNRLFLVNSRLDVALALPGAGAHIGRHSLPVSDARRLLGPQRILGYSAHAIEEAAEALAAGADYVTLSPIFTSISKPGLEPRGLPFLREAITRLPRGKVVALGGMNRQRLVGIRGSGAGGAAIMGALMTAAEPGPRAEELVRAWEGP